MPVADIGEQAVGETILRGDAWKQIVVGAAAGGFRTTEILVIKPGIVVARPVLALTGNLAAATCVGDSGSNSCELVSVRSQRRPPWICQAAIRTLPSR